MTKVEIARSLWRNAAFVALVAGMALGIWLLQQRDADQRERAQKAVAAQAAEDERLRDLDLYHSLVTMCRRLKVVRGQTNRVSAVARRFVIQAAASREEAAALTTDPRMRAANLQTAAGYRKLAGGFTQIPQPNCLKVVTLRDGEVFVRPPARPE